jgi:hypothetical protein
MKLIQHERDRFHVELKEVGDVERPPIALLPEYRAAHPPRSAPARRGGAQPVPALPTASVVQPGEAR